MRSLLSEANVEKDDLENLLNSYKYEEAAQLLFDSMTPSAFDEALENEYGCERPLSGAVRYLPTLFRSSVITTNFDDTLKRCYDNAGQSFSDVLLGSDAHELPRYLGQEKNVLVKLHGKATSRTNRVLTLNEYSRHYSDEGSLQKCIKAISTKTLLFLGCSLGVDRTLDCMKKIIKSEGSDSMPRHYAFLKINDKTDKFQRKKELSVANIFPIWYEDDHDECIEALLEKLAEE